MHNIERRLIALEAATIFRDIRDVPTLVLEAMLAKHFGHTPTDDELQALANEGVK